MRRTHHRSRFARAERGKNLLICLGLLVFGALLYVFSLAVSRQADYWAGVRVQGASGLSDLAPNTPVLAYGRLEQPDQRGPLAVYLIEQCSRDSKGNCTWREVSRTTPPVIVTVDGRQVRVVNGDYALEGALAETTWDEPVGWGVQRMRARGFFAQDGVTVAGSATADGTALRATALYRGTPESYRFGWVALTWTLRIGAALCGLLSVGMGIMVWRS